MALEPQRAKVRSLPWLIHYGSGVVAGSWYGFQDRDGGYQQAVQTPTKTLGFVGKEGALHFTREILK